MLVKRFDTDTHVIEGSSKCLSLSDTDTHVTCKKDHPRINVDTDTHVTPPSDTGDPVPLQQTLLQVLQVFQIENIFHFYKH